MATSEIEQNSELIQSKDEQSALTEKKISTQIIINGILVEDVGILSTILLNKISEKNDTEIITILENIQNLSGWKTLESVNPSSKGKAIKHGKFGKLAGGKLDENGNIELENFSFFPISGGNIIRMGGRALRYTNTK